MMTILPLGSIVSLKGSAQLLMILGRGLEIELDGQMRYYEYAGTEYPQGMVNDQVIYFNSDEISKVHYKGYSDASDKLAMNKINHYVKEKHPELLKRDYEA